MEKQTMIMSTDKEIKNTIRYAADPTRGPAACRTLYIERWALGEPVPDKVQVVIESVED